MKLTEVWGAKLKVCLRPHRIVCRCRLSLLCIHRRTQMWTATFVEEDGASMVSLNGLPCGRREDRIGTPSESSDIATEPLKRKLLFQHCSAMQNSSNFACSVMTPKCVIWHLRGNNIRTHKSVNWG